MTVIKLMLKHKLYSQAIELRDRAVIRREQAYICNLLEDYELAAECITRMRSNYMKAQWAEQRALLIN